MFFYLNKGAVGAGFKKNGDFNVRPFLSMEDANKYLLET